MSSDERNANLERALALALVRRLAALDPMMWTGDSDRDDLVCMFCTYGTMTHVEFQHSPECLWLLAQAFASETGDSDG